MLNRIKDKIKNLNYKKAVDVLLIIIFLIFIFLPMLHIDIKTDVSDKENRRLAKWQPLFSNEHSINYNFGNDFDNWFKDRFFLRKLFIDIYFNLKYRLAVICYEHERYFINKKTNYMTSVLYFNSQPNAILFDYELTDIIKNIKKAEKFCENNNIKLYIFIVPRKDEIGSDLSYPLLTNHKTYLLTKKKIRYLSNFSNVPIIYPYDILSKAQKNNVPVYFKSDYHWTDIGAHIAYLEFMNILKKDFKNVIINELDDFETFESNLVRVCPVYGFFPGENYESLHLDDLSVLDEQYTYLVPKNKENIEESHIPNYPEYYIVNKYKNNNNVNAPNLFMYGDSGSLSMLPSLVSSFHNTESIFSWGNNDEDLIKHRNLEKFYDEIIKNKTDILLLGFSSLGGLKFLFKE